MTERINLRLEIPQLLLEQIHHHGERSYPEEGAGFLLGVTSVEKRQVKELLVIENAREDGSRHNRYLLTPRDVLEGENEAARRGLDIVGVFHSHPDHPDQPSEFDREWALPWLSYLITRIDSAKAVSSRSWRLADNRELFDEENLIVIPKVESN
jgi:proteasome lid subunit RPN8/RPN11